MFVDFTTEQIRVDPWQYPTTLVIRTHYHQPDDEVECASRGYRLSPWLLERTAVGTRTFEVRDYLLTRHEEETGLAEDDNADFLVTSNYMDEDNTWRRRRIALDILLRTDVGWVVEMTDLDLETPEPPHTIFSVDLGIQFDPRATLDDPPSPVAPQPVEVPEEKPPGRPIWERLDDEG